MRYVIVILLIATIAMSYTYHGAYLLDGPVQSPDAATFGMGNLRVLPPESPASALWAPATLPKNGGCVGLFTSLNHISESRAIPLYDSFDDRVGWTPYVSMAETYGDFALFVSYGFEGEWLPSVAAGYAPVFDARYIYREEVRAQEGATQDNLLGVWSIDGMGKLAGPVIAVSEPILEYATIGVSATMLSGTIEMHRSPAAGDSITHNVEPWEEAFDTDTVYSADLSGTMIDVQAIITPNDRWQIGLRYLPQTDLGESLYPDFLPSRFGFGVGFRPIGYVQSRIAVEAELVGYSALGDEDSAFASLDDSWEFRIGLEHMLPRNIPFRIGMQQRTVPLPDPIVKTGFTIGSGVSFGPATLDISMGYEMTRYNNHDQFPESWLASSGGDREDYDRVEEGILTGAVGVLVEF